MRSKALMLLPLLFVAHFAQAQKTTYADLSTRLVVAARYGRPTQAMRDSLAVVTPDQLSGELDNDAARLTFWVNVYNAHVQILLTQAPSLFDDRGAFFKQKQVTIAGRSMSFDDLEHGIIRGSKWKLGLGIVPKPFPGKFERKLRVRKTDPRVHLALNCGAKSCPPVAAYQMGKVDGQLDASARRFLEKTTAYDAQAGKVAISPLFSWFRGDWGSKRKVVKFLKKHGAVPPGATPKISYTDYDWTLSTGNYIDL